MTTSCLRPKACIEEVAVEVEVGEPVVVHSCSKRANFFSWYVNGDLVYLKVKAQEEFDNLSNGFGSNTGSDFVWQSVDYVVEDGGEFCNEHMELFFKESGKYEITLEVFKATSGSCSSGNAEGGFLDVETAIIVVK